MTLSLLAGCAAVPPADGPMERVEFRYRPGRKVDRLLVLIHGRGDDPRSFAEHGFLNELAKRAIPIDVVAVYAHPGYYAERNLAKRLHDDVIFPKRQEGYRKIYVLGVSRGGLGALAFARRYANEPDGLVLLAPFLGPRTHVEEIEAAGGLTAWRPHPPVEDIERIWQWLRGYGTGADRPPLYLLLGEQDPFVPQMKILEEVLPDERTLSIPGEHDWKTWRALFGAFLDRDPFGWIR